MNIISEFSYLFFKTSGNTIVSNEYNKVFPLNAHYFHYTSYRVPWIWQIWLLILPFTLLKQAFKNSTFYLESVVLVIHLPTACQSEHSLHYFHLDRISDLFSIHHSSSHTLLAAKKRFSVAQQLENNFSEKSIKYGCLKIQVLVQN